MFLFVNLIQFAHAPKDSMSYIACCIPFLFTSCTLDDMAVTTAGNGYLVIAASWMAATRE